MNVVKPKRGMRALLFSTALMLGVFTPAFVNAGNDSQASARIEALEVQTNELSQTLNVLNFGFGVETPVPPANIGSESRVYVAQSRDVAAMNLRLSQVEEQMRILTGQVEGLQFQMTQFQTLIERLQEDNEFRFQQLEGGGSGKTEAVAQSGGDRPSGELPQNQIDDEPVLTGTDNMEVGGNLTGDESTLEQSGISLGTLDLPSAQLDSGQALDLSFDPGSLITNEDADAQYKAGFDAVMQGDYHFAEAQFNQFVALFPEHELAPDATNWLGEALLQRGQYDAAAQVLFEGFEKYQHSVRGPDLLLRLGIALAGAGERDTACRTFGEVLRRYPSMDGAFETRVAAELARAQC